MNRKNQSEERLSREEWKKENRQLVAEGLMYVLMFAGFGFFGAFFGAALYANGDWGVFDMLASLFAGIVFMMLAAVIATIEKKPSYIEYQIKKWQRLLKKVKAE